MGIFFAILAMFGWGLADFLISKTTRKIGSAFSLFYITTFGVFVLLPFVYQDIPSLLTMQTGSREIWVLLGAGVFALIASVFDFEALRTGKVALVEPVYAIEIIGTLLVAGIVLNEWLNFYQTSLVLSVVLGVFLISLKSLSRFKNIQLERGILYAFVAVVFMIGENFLTAYGSRLTNPLLTNWFVNIIITGAVLGYLLSRGKFHKLIHNIKTYPKLIFWVSFFDTLGWISFSYSVTYIPIGLALGISEAYIAVAVSLGLLINKEKLKFHHFIGIFVTITASVILILIS